MTKNYLNDLLDKLGDKEYNINTTLSQIVATGGIVDTDMATLIKGLSG